MLAGTSAPPSRDPPPLVDGAPRTAQLGHGVARHMLRSRTLPPATATGTLVVAHDDLWVIDPGTDRAEELTALAADMDAHIADGRALAGIVLTHHHLDHVAGAGWLQRRYDASIFAHTETARRLRETRADWNVSVAGAQVVGRGAQGLTLLPTPGHAPGHVVVVDETTGVAYVGDMVAGLGTVVIDPDDDGDMALYVQSLCSLITRVGARETRAARISMVVPAHGPIDPDPTAALKRTLEHRRMRERKIFAVLARGPLEGEELLARAYDDVPMGLRPLARRALAAHLIKLHAEARIEPQRPLAAHGERSARWTRGRWRAIPGESP